MNASVPRQGGLLQRGNWREGGYHLMKYQNRQADCVGAWQNLANWQAAQERSGLGG